MSPLMPPARTSFDPVRAGRAALPADIFAASATATITTGTGTIGPGRVSVRR